MSERSASEPSSATPLSAAPRASAGTLPASTTLRPPRRWRRTAVEVAALVLAFLAIRAWNGRALAERPPAGALVTLDGTRVTPSEPDGPLVVHFFATWCGVCEAEEGNVAALARDHRVLAIASQSGGEHTVRAYLDEHGLAHVPVALDTSGDLAAAWGVSAFPATFYLNGDGEISTTEIGYTSELGMRFRAFLAR